MVYYIEEVRILWKKFRYTKPYYCNLVFTNQLHAEKYAGSFVRSLIEKNLIPEDVLDKETRILNEDRIKIGIVPLEVVELEREDEWDLY